MSRAYRVRISESIERVIHVEDGVAAPLELLPVLGKNKMRELLASQLELGGFVREGDVARRVEVDGIVIEIDLTQGLVKVRIEDQRDVRREVERTGHAEESRVQAQETRLRKEVNEALEREVELATEELRREATAKLERRLIDLKREMDTVVGQVTIRALKEKAASIGEVQEVQEDGAGNLVIKIKV